MTAASYLLKSDFGYDFISFHYEMDLLIFIKHFFLCSIHAWAGYMLLGIVMQIF